MAYWVVFFRGDTLFCVRDGGFIDRGPDLDHNR